MGYALREHTADVAVEATGDTIGTAFAAAANGMAAAMCQDIPDGAGDRHTVAVAAESREALLFDYLDRLIYERDVRSVLPVENTGRITSPEGYTSNNGATGTDGRHTGDGPGAGAAPSGDPAAGAWRFEGGYRGVSLARVDARDLKAVTYSEMTIEETAQGWRVYVVFDV